MENKLTVSEQIQRLKERYGIKFETISENDAISFLKANTYYAKIRAYVNSFEKYQESYRSLQCVGVDFVHLVELSKLDMYLRKAVISLSLDVEHAMKTFFISELTNDCQFDGYEFVSNCEGYFEYDRMIEHALSSEYSKEIAKRFDRERNIWNLIELISFRELAMLLEIYSTEKHDKYKRDYKLMYASRMLRNAAAHNNCLLHNLNPNRNPYEFSSSQELGSYLSKLKIGNKNHNRIMQIPVLHDLASLLVLLKLRSSEGIRQRRFNELFSFLDRCKENGGYFSKHINLIKCYESLCELLDKLH